VATHQVGKVNISNEALSGQVIGNCRFFWCVAFRSHGMTHATAQQGSCGLDRSRIDTRALQAHAAGARRARRVAQAAGQRTGWMI